MNTYVALIAARGGRVVQGNLGTASIIAFCFVSTCSNAVIKEPMRCASA